MIFVSCSLYSDSYVANRSSNRSEDLQENETVIHYGISFDFCAGFVKEK